MRIAQIAPLTESVPPKLYGGTERIVSYLTEELTSLGHDVTLFASGDSVTSATLEPMSRCALRFDPRCATPMRRTWRCWRRCIAARMSSTCCTVTSTIGRSRCSAAARRRS